MNASLAWAVVVGLGLGLGLWALIAQLPRVGARRLAARVAPHILDVSAEAWRLRNRRATDPASMLSAFAAPVVVRARRLVAGTVGGDAVIERRLRQADHSLTVAGFRSRQLAWGAAGSSAGLVIALIAWRAASIPSVAAVVLGVATAIGGLVLPEQLLAGRARARISRITAELPTVLEFLSLTLAAGETVRDSLRRISRLGSGELAREFERVMADVDLGIPLSDALTRCAASLEVAALSRATEQLVMAIERGSPLVDVLRSQAQDSREDAKRLLLEAAGRKEVAMLVPLVFGVLPVTIVFAIFPATLVLEAGF